MSTATIRETLLRKVNVLPDDYCPKVLRFIETLEKDVDSKSLVVSSLNGEDEKRTGVSEEFEQSLEKVNRRFAKVLQKLA